MRARWTGRERPALVAAALIAIGLVQAYAFRGVRLDDAYITYRYGQNLASGGGFVFNLGERVLGTTAPGHALLAAVTILLSGDAALPTAMACLGSIGWSLQALVLWRWFATEGDELLGTAIAVCVALGAARSYMWAPLETNLAAAASLSSLYLFSRKRFAGSGALLGIAVLLRPDAVIVVVPLAVLAQVRRLRPPLSAVAAAGAPVVAWAIFAQLYFGSPLPTTLSKAGAVSFGEYARHVFESVPTTLLVAHTGVWGSLALWVVAAFGAFSLWTRYPSARALVVYFLVFVGAYLGLRPNTAFGWHLYPANLMFTVFVVAALVRAPVALSSYVVALPSAKRAAAVASVLLVASLSAAAVRGAFNFAEAYPTAFWYGGRDEVYRRAGQFLRENVAPDEIVLSEEVGTLAFVSGRKFHDYPGLVAPEAFRHHTKDDPAALFEHIRGARYRWLFMTSAEQLRFHEPLLEGARIVHLPFGRWDIWIARLSES